MGCSLRKCGDVGLYLPPIITTTKHINFLAGTGNQGLKLVIFQVLGGKMNNNKWEHSKTVSDRETDRSYIHQSLTAQFIQNKGKSEGIKLILTRPSEDFNNSTKTRICQIDLC